MTEGFAVEDVAVVGDEDYGSGGFVVVDGVLDEGVDGGEGGRSRGLGRRACGGDGEEEEREEDLVTEGHCLLCGASRPWTPRYMVESGEVDGELRSGWFRV